MIVRCAAAASFDRVDIRFWRHLLPLLCCSVMVCSGSRTSLPQSFMLSPSEHLRCAAAQIDGPAKSNSEPMSLRREFHALENDTVYGNITAQYVKASLGRVQEQGLIAMGTTIAFVLIAVLECFLPLTEVKASDSCARGNNSGNSSGIVELKQLESPLLLHEAEEDDLLGHSQNGGKIGGGRAAAAAVVPLPKEDAAVSTTFVKCSDAADNTATVIEVRHGAVGRDEPGGGPLASPTGGGGGVGKQKRLTTSAAASVTAPSSGVAEDEVLL